MKNIIIIALSGFLIYMFLVYAGAFRDFTNPLEVAKYYLECVRNREGFLTYPIYKREYFDEDKHGNIYRENKLFLVDKIKLTLLKLAGNYANVRAELIYKDNRLRYCLIELEQVNSAWLVKNVKFIARGSN